MAEATGASPPSELDIEAARWFFQNSVDIFVLIRGDTIARINPAWTEVSGWSVEESVGRKIEEFIHPEDGDAVRAIVSALAEDGLADGEHRLVRKDGGVAWVRSRAKRGSGGATIVVLEDVTDEHLQAEATADARRTNEILREEVGVFLWRFNPETNQYIVDPDMTRQGSRGTPGNRVLSTDEMTSEIHPDDRIAMGEAFFASLATGEARVIEYRHFRAETGGWSRLRAAWRGIRETAGGKWEILGLTQDVTEVAEARDAALAAAEAKSQFLANISHEIRTPMNGVLGVLHLLKNEPLSDDARKLLAEAVGCGHMLAELLNDVIDFSKIEAGRLELSPEPVDPAAILESVAGLLRPQAEAAGLKLKVHADPSLGWTLLDPVRLRQILFNLIGNAVKFTVEGGVDACLRKVWHPDGDRLRFEIVDSGVGISAEAQAALFQRFQQGDGSTTRRFGGSGLGLAISRRLAELMGGEIGVESEEGRGSTFWFEVAASKVAEPEHQIVETGALLDGLRVLVVEDNPTNRLIATRLLEQLGAEVTTAEDGRRGVDAATQQAFDLIFMDVQMPVMDGVEATRLIRGLPAPAGLVPILAMTANAMAHQTAGYLSAGMNGVVAKPLSPAELIARIADLLSSPTTDEAAA